MSTRALTPALRSASSTWCVPSTFAASVSAMLLKDWPTCAAPAQWYTTLGRRSAIARAHGSAIEQVDVLAPPARHVSAGGLQMLDQIAPDESAGAGDEDAGHVREPYCVW